jgi:hypothetical protein
MPEYTLPILFEPLKNNNTIQTIFDTDALVAPIKAAIAGYVATLGLPAAETAHLSWENTGAAIYLEQLVATYHLPSLGVQTPAPAIKRNTTLADKVAEISSLNGKYPKCQLMLYVRNSAAEQWVWKNTEVIQNYGNRANTLDLIPYLSQGTLDIFGKATQIGIQFIADPVFKTVLPAAGDRLSIKGALRVEVSQFDSKKNDVTEQLMARIGALELALEGRLVNLPANSLLGRTAGAGVVEVIPQASFKAADTNLFDGFDSDEVFTASGFFDVRSGTLPSDFILMQGFQARHGNPTNLWGVQAGCQHNKNGEFYFRTVSGGVFQPWRRVWNDANFVPMSHLQHFTTPSARGFAISSTVMPSATPAIAPGFEVQALNGSVAAYFGLHRPGAASAYFGLDADNFLKYGGGTQSGLYRVWHEQYGTPVWQAPSDGRLKKAILPIKSALNLVLECRPVRFEYKSQIANSEMFGDRHSRLKCRYGFVAQDFPITDLVSQKSNGFLGIDYLELIPFLVRSIQELHEMQKHLSRSI